MPTPTRIAPKHRQRTAALALALFAAGLAPAFAQTTAPETLAELRRELDALKTEQAERDQRIRSIENTLNQLQGVASTSTPAASPPTPAPAAAAPSTAAIAAGAPASDDRFKVTGDLRIRAQGDYSDDDGDSRNSGQVRARLAATWSPNDLVTIGARLVTGDPDNPRSTDVQLSNWADDLEASLDQAYIQLNFDKLTLTGGKIPQPFTRTDLVWDGDVNPQGFGATYRTPLASGGTLRANGLFFIIDEQQAGKDSTMLGGQLGFDSPAHGDWRWGLTGGYYHYDLGGVPASSDLRSNLVRPDGRHLSDFHLANLIATVNYAGFGEQWPLRLTADYVRNLGAETEADTGYGADLVLGKASSLGDWRFTYGYSMAQTDAVLAAFSHDNIGIATNYRLHALTVDYVPIPNTLLSAIWYHYKPYSAIDAGGNDPQDWLDRLRLAFMVSF